MVDLHTHSTFSDGTLTPARIAEEAARAGLTAVGLTDHDTVAGNDEFLSAGAEHEIEAIAGVEISAQYTNPETGLKDDGEMHILGYFPWWNEKTEAAMSPLAEIRENRRERNPKIIERLQQLGCEITVEEVERLAQNDVVGRPHIAALLVQKGFVKNAGQAFDQYLAKEAAAYVPKEIFPPDVAMRVIRDAGGVPVLAHPKTLNIQSDEQFRGVLELLVSHGLLGIEAHCSSHKWHDTQRFLGYAYLYSLVVTGGSDFHGSLKPYIHLGTGLGNMRAPDKCVEELRARCSAL